MSFFTISFTQKSELEFLDAPLFYEFQQVGLGVRFQSTINKLLQTISKNLYAYQRKYKHYREVLAKPFPYLVVYEIGGKEIIVVAIFNAKQHPNKKFK